LVRTAHPTVCFSVRCEQIAGLCDGACGAAQDDGIGGGGGRRRRIDEHKGCRDYFLLFDFFGVIFFLFLRLLW